jgi:hypothetical protein
MTSHTATELTSPHDLLAAVPFMVGYHPVDSLVVMALRESRVAMAMRVDYPSQEAMEEISQRIVAHLLREQSSEAIIVGYLPADLSDPDPLAYLKECISSRGILVKEAIEVRAGRFRSSICPDFACCPPEGNPLPPLSDSRITAEQVAAGNPLPFLDLDELKSSIAATPVDRELVREIKKISEIDYEADGVNELQREGANALNKLLEEFTSHGIEVQKELIALVLVRLLDLQVRDYAMGMATPETTDLLWDMWRWILRIAPRGYVAPVSTIFATMTYERGEGALAQRALDRAFDDDPKYQMAKLLRRTFAAGWPPSAFSQMRAELHPKICEALFGGNK